MAYREFVPPGPLRALAECGWSHTVGPGEAPHVQQVLPDGCMDLIWNGAELLVAGPDTAAHPVPRRPGPAVVGLRFAPGALPALLEVPAAALRDQRVELAELHRRLARETRLPDPASPAAALRMLGEVAVRLPGRPDRAAPALAGVLGTGAGVGATADALGCTTRTLHRRCLAAFGYGPAVLRRVLRFRHAVELLHAGVAPAQVAVAAGYADQPHLSREMRAMAGAAPRQVVSGANRSTPLPSGSSTTA